MLWRLDGSIVKGDAMFKTRGIPVQLKYLASIGISVSLLLVLCWPSMAIWADDQVKSEDVSTAQPSSNNAAADDESNASQPHTSVEGEHSIADDGDHTPDQGAQRTRIHVLALSGMDAIVLESNGHFAMVDSGITSQVPDRNSPLWHAGINPNRADVADQVINYLTQLGVTTENFDCYIGTHPHSDHIGTAPDVIRAFHPKRVYTPHYEDRYLKKQESGVPALFDSLFMYQRLAQAASEVGATFITTFTSDAPIDPVRDTAAEESSSADAEVSAREITSAADQGVSAPREYVGRDTFTLGDMTLTLENIDPYYRTTPVYDANYFCLGVLVEAHGHSAFLAGDISSRFLFKGRDIQDDTYDDEAAIAEKIDTVDMLKVGHHGYWSSNSPGFVNAIQPKIAVLTNSFDVQDARILKLYEKYQTKIYAAQDFKNYGEKAVVVSLDGDTVRVENPLNADLDFQPLLYGDDKNDAYDREPNKPCNQPLVHLVDNQLTAYSGWVNHNGGDSWNTGKYYFDDSAFALCRTTREIDGKTYRFDGFGRATEVSSHTGGGGFSGGGGSAGPGGGSSRSTSGKVGWVSENGSWVYYENSQKKTNAWVGDYYVGSDGAMVTSQWVDSGVWYVDASGRAVSPNACTWHKNKKGWWLATPDENYATSTWVYRDNTWYHFDSEGYLQTGWFTAGTNSWYYAWDSGSLATDWIYSNKNWYYLASWGAMQTGWQYIDNQWYYLDESGAMRTGWLFDRGAWYFLKESGAMARAERLTVSGTSYSFSLSGTLQ